jgi:hypothetical protein
VIDLNIAYSFFKKMLQNLFTFLFFDVYPCFHASLMLPGNGTSFNKLPDQLPSFTRLKTDCILCHVPCRHQPSFACSAPRAGQLCAILRCSLPQADGLTGLGRIFFGHGASYQHAYPDGTADFISTSAALPPTSIAMIHVRTMTCHAADT